MTSRHDVWSQTTLGAICAVNPVKPKLSTLPDATPVLFVPMTSVDEATGQISAPIEKTLGEVRNKSYTSFASGDVIFAKITPCMENGKAAIVPPISTGLGFGSTEFHVLRPKPEVDPKFIWHLVRQESFRRDAEAHMTGSVGQARVPATFLHNFPVLLPPEPLQREIVRLLDATTEARRSVAGHLAAAKRAINRFRQSVLAAAWSGRLTADWRAGNQSRDAAYQLMRSLTDVSARKERAIGQKGQAPFEGVGEDLDFPDTWTWSDLDGLVEEGRPIIYGIIKPGPHVSDGIPYVRVTEMKDGVISPVSQLRRASQERASRFARATLKAGDLLISKDGTIGRVAIVPPELAGANITQHLVRVSIHPSMNREFVADAIRAPQSQAWLVGETKGVALQGVNVEDFRRLPIPVPPSKEQDEIVHRLSHLLGLADGVVTTISRMQRKTDRLTDSVLATIISSAIEPEGEQSPKADPMGPISEFTLDAFRDRLA